MKPNPSNPKPLMESCCDTIDSALTGMHYIYFMKDEIILDHLQWYDSRWLKNSPHHLLQQNSGNQLALLLMEVGPEGGKKPLGNFGTTFLGVKKRHYSNITVDK